MRSPTEEGNKHILDMLKTCADAACKVTGCSYDLPFLGASRTGLPDLAISGLAYKNMQDIGAPKFMREEKELYGQIQKNVGMQTMDEPFSRGDLQRKLWTK